MWAVKHFGGRLAKAFMARSSPRDDPTTGKPNHSRPGLESFLSTIDLDHAQDRIGSGPGSEAIERVSDLIPVLDPLGSGA
jgi:hypothetical protein